MVMPASSCSNVSCSSRAMRLRSSRTAPCSIFSRMIFICSRSLRLRKSMPARTRNRIPLTIPSSQSALRRFHHEGACSTTTSCGERRSKRKERGVDHSPPLRTRHIPVTRTWLFTRSPETFASDACSICPSKILSPCCKSRRGPSGCCSRWSNLASVVTSAPSYCSQGVVRSNVMGCGGGP